MTAIDNLIHAIYAIVSADEAVEPMLVALAQQFECGSAALFYLNSARPTANITTAHGPFRSHEVLDLYQREYAMLDPAPAAMARLRVGEVASTDDIFQHTMDRHRRFIDEFYNPLGLYGAMGGPIVTAAGQVGMVAVHRGQERAAFRPDELADLARLIPHLARAIELRQRFFALTSQVEALNATLEPMSIGLLVLENGLVTEANASARSILARADGLTLDPLGRLDTSDREFREKLRAHLTADLGGCVGTIRRSHGSRYGVRIRPIGGDPGRYRCAVVICDPDSARVDATQLVGDLYRLSRQAARLVVALLDGCTIETFARDSCISRHTAKFHLKAAFAATGTRRQSDLIRIVSPIVQALSSAL